MRYIIQHATRYDYHSVVPFARHVLRMTPADSAKQQVIATALVIAPLPAEQFQVIDMFGNRTLEIAIETDHRQLDIRGTDQVVVRAAAPPSATSTPAWEDIATTALATSDMSSTSPAHFVFASALARPAPQITAYARTSFPLGCAVLAGAIDLKRRIARDFIYDPQATDVETPVVDAFAGGRGVCQDFAHIMIAALRGLGVPAGYISGYLATSPPPGQPRLTGADAMHAWVRVWCGHDVGWVDLDPTNAVVVDQGHVTLALGRDYADVAPTGGVIIASDGHSMSNWVDVDATIDAT